MKKILLLFLALHLISCGNDKSSNNWSVSKMFETDKTIENVTINDKKFLYEMVTGEKTECYLNIKLNEQKDYFTDKNLRDIINQLNEYLIGILIVPSSYRPSDYIFDANNKNFDKEYYITVDVSYSGKNDENGIFVYKLSKSFYKNKNNDGFTMVE
jgi:hypothetical protein